MKARQRRHNQRVQMGTKEKRELRGRHVQNRDCDDDLAFGSVLEQYLQNFAKRHQLGLDVFLFKGGGISEIPCRRSAG